MEKMAELESKPRHLMLNPRSALVFFQAVSDAFDTQELWRVGSKGQDSHTNLPILPKKGSLTETSRNNAIMIYEHIQDSHVIPRQQNQTTPIEYF